MYIFFSYKVQSSAGYNLSHVTQLLHVLFPQPEMMFKTRNNSWLLPQILQRIPCDNVRAGPEGFSVYLVGLVSDVDWQLWEGLREGRIAH